MRFHDPSLWNSTPLGFGSVGVQRLRAGHGDLVVPTRMLRWGSALRLKGDVSMSVRSIGVRLEPALGSICCTRVRLRDPSLWNSTPLGFGSVGVQRLRARYSYSAIPTRMIRWGSALRPKRDGAVSVRSIRVRLEIGTRLDMLYLGALARPCTLEFNPAGVQHRWCAAFTRQA